MKFESFENLEVWKLSRELKLEIKEVIEKFPTEEKYLLRNQLIRCSRSIGANIAEGLVDFITKRIYVFASMQEEV